MPSDSRRRPSVAYGWLLHLASWIAPADARSEWLRLRNLRLQGWWILRERGELVGDVSARPLCFQQETFADAFRRRFHYDALRRSMSGPSFLLANAAAALLLLAMASHGFAVTRSVYLAAGPKGDRVFAYTAPIVAAFAVGMVMLLQGRPRLRQCGWRYGMLLVSKLAAIVVILPLLWIEGGHAVRSAMPTLFLREMLMGVLLAAAFVVVFCRAVAWSIADQRRRCPVCLQRFAVPVAMGSWASVFDPPATEFLCDRGHGSLSVAGTESGGGVCWMALETTRRD